MKNILSTTIIGCLLIGCTETTPLSSTDQQEKTATANYPTETINCGTHSDDNDGKETTKNKFYYLESINKALLESPKDYSALGLTTITNCDEAKKYIDFKNSNINSTPSKSDLSSAPIEEGGQEESSRLALKSKPQIAMTGGSAYSPLTEEFGVISIYNEWNPVNSCTGVMINANYALTSGNCIQDKSQSHDKTFNTRSVGINYFDPWDGSPSPRLVKPPTTNLLVKVIPTYDGSGDHQDNIAIIYNSAGWTNTRTWDYKRIHQDATWKAHYNTFYGQGRTDFSYGGSEGRAGFLRKTGINWRWSSKYFAEAITAIVRTCEGDEGGPYIANPVYGSYDMITGIHSGQENTNSDGYGGTCGSYGDRIKIATLSSRTGWIEQEMGFTCNRYSQLSTDGRTTNNYKRCW